MRTLCTLAALSVVWIVGYFLLTVTGAFSGAPFLLPWAVYTEVAPLGAELGFVVGILALMATASRRHVAWLALVALLVALLHLLPLVIFKTPATFLTVFQVPVVLFAQGAWVVLLPALLPASPTCPHSLSLMGRHSSLASQATGRTSSVPDAVSCAPEPAR